MLYPLSYGGVYIYSLLIGTRLLQGGAWWLR